MEELDIIDLPTDALIVVLPVSVVIIATIVVWLWRALQWSTGLEARVTTVALICSLVLIAPLATLLLLRNSPPVVIDHWLIASMVLAAWGAPIVVMRLRFGEWPNVLLIIFAPLLWVRYGIELARELLFLILVGFFALFVAGISGGLLAALGVSFDDLPPWLVGGTFTLAGIVILLMYMFSPRPRFFDGPDIHPSEIRDYRTDNKALDGILWTGERR